MALRALWFHRDLLQWKGRRAPLPVIPGQWPAPENSDDRTTFLAHALSLTALHGPGPWPDDGHPLPDETPSKDLFLSSTVQDGIRTHHGGSDNDSPPAASLAIDIAEIIAAPSIAAMTALHDRLAARPALEIADDLVRELHERNLSAEDLRHLARALIEHGTRRNAVAVGIIILGVAGDHRDRELLLLMGHLDDLTLYAAVALAKTQPDRDKALHQLAQSVDGWGRIHTVERLRGTQDPEIKAWLLRGGFRNGVLNQYLAHIAATTGDLYSALLASEVDVELLDGTAGILNALLDLHGPTADILDYADALPCLARFGELIADTPPNLTYIDTAERVVSLLKEPPSMENWPETDIASLLGRYSDLLAQPDWSARVRTALDNPTSASEFRQGLTCSEAVGIDALPHALSRLRRPPHDGYIWYWAATHIPEGEYTTLIQLAARVLPLAEMSASSPDPERIIGGSDEEHALDVVLSYVRDAPVAEADVLPLIRAALRGAGTRIRGIGLRALKSRYGQDLPPTPRAWVGEAVAIEPDDKLRTEFADLLNQVVSEGEQ